MAFAERMWSDDFAERDPAVPDYKTRVNLWHDAIAQAWAAADRLRGECDIYVDSKLAEFEDFLRTVADEGEQEGPTDGGPLPR